MVRTKDRDVQSQAEAEVTTREAKLTMTKLPTGFAFNLQAPQCTQLHFKPQTIVRRSFLRNQ